MSDPQTKLGQLIEPGMQRDAIHIAVAPVKAAMTLRPGDDIGFIASSPESVGHVKNPIGIVDPFLKRDVKPGERFWMFLYPNTITSLKHVWTHPAFIVEPAPAVSSRTDKKASEAWLRAFVDGANCPGYEEVIAAAVGGGASSWDEDYLHFDGSDAHGEIPAEFWDHVEIVTGRKISKRARYFSCAC